MDSVGLASPAHVMRCLVALARRVSGSGYHRHFQPNISKDDLEIDVHSRTAASGESVESVDVTVYFFDAEEIRQYMHLRISSYPAVTVMGHTGTFHLANGTCPSLAWL